MNKGHLALRSPAQRVGFHLHGQHAARRGGTLGCRRSNDVVGGQHRAAVNRAPYPAAPAPGSSHRCGPPRAPGPRSRYPQPPVITQPAGPAQAAPDRAAERHARVPRRPRRPARPMPHIRSSTGKRQLGTTALTTRYSPAVGMMRNRSDTTRVWHDFSPSQAQSVGNARPAPQTSAGLFLRRCCCCT